MNKTALIIDDSPNVRREIIETLSAASLFSSFLEAGDGVEGLKIVLNSPVDLILCDLVMPRMDGFRFIKLVREKAALRDVPIIMLTGKGETEMKIEGLESGANDYVTKPFDRGELLARAKVHLNVKALQDELKAANRLLEALSNTDHLTRLYNRRFLFDALEKEFLRIARKGGTLALIILDLDHFKRINDTFGHVQGDFVLAGVAEVIVSELRRYDLAARYGGEEYVVVLPECTTQEGMEVAERLRKSVFAMTFPPPLQEENITASLGVAGYPAPGIASVDDLLAAADAAMYRAKEAGRNAVVAAFT